MHVTEMKKKLLSVQLFASKAAKLLSWLWKIYLCKQTKNNNKIKTHICTCFNKQHL